MSPFRLHRRIGPRPAFLGVDATVNVVGAAPFVEPERRSSGSGLCGDHLISPTDSPEEPLMEIGTEFSVPSVAR